MGFFQPAPVSDIKFKNFAAVKPATTTQVINYCCPHKNYIFTVGNNGEIWRYTVATGNNLGTYKLMPKIGGLSLAISGICSDGVNLFAGLFNNGIWRSGDDGDNWTKVYTDTSFAVGGCASNGRVTVIGEYNTGSTVLYTADGGDTWNTTDALGGTVNVSEANIIYDFDSGYFVRCSTSQRISLSSNGISWVAFNFQGLGFTDMKGPTIKDGILYAAESGKSQLLMWPLGSPNPPERVVGSAYIGGASGSQFFGMTFKGKIYIIGTAGYGVVSDDGENFAPITFGGLGTVSGTPSIAGNGDDILCQVGANFFKNFTG
jgi:photosystem II stability/assembly factor-like uncharacterized protein